jgi:hypothetical protein
MNYYSLLEKVMKAAENKEPWEKDEIRIYFENPERDLYNVSFVEIDSEGDIILS